MNHQEYAGLDALGLKSLIDKGELTATEVNRIALEGIKKLNPALNAMVSSSAIARESIGLSMDKDKPLSGIPFLLKAGVGMEGQPLVAGCRMAEDLIGESDSTLVRQVKTAGLAILGSTNAPELCSSDATESVLYGPARNPWHLDHSTGGSSGGAAAAVAAGIVPMAQAADGGGSIRTPAHCCGVFGLIPSRGRTAAAANPWGGPIEFTRQHVLTRSVRDSAAMLDQLKNPEPESRGLSTSPQPHYLDSLGRKRSPLKIGFSTTSPSGKPVHPDCVAAVHKAVQYCQDRGHRLEECAPHYDWETFAHAFEDQWAINVTLGVRQLEKHTGKVAGPDTLEKSTLLALEHARSLTGEQINRSCHQVYQIAGQAERFFNDWDIFLSPTCLGPAPLIGALNGNAPSLTGEQWFEHYFAAYVPFLPVWNVSGQPAMSVPLHQSNDGLPIGVHCVARFGEEQTLLQLAAELEEAAPWVQRHPPHSLFN